MKTIIVLCAILGYAYAGCGTTPVPPDMDKIVGGQVATPYSWPWQVVFCRGSGASCSLMCGGSVIAPGWVMTAGHCVYGNDHNPQGFQIKAGVFDESKNAESGERMVKIKRMILHPDYNHEQTSHDIALLELATPLEYTNHIQPVCLPNSDSILKPATMVTVTGWGTTSSGGSISKKLQQVDVPIVSYATCNSEYNGEVQNDVMFCAGVFGKDSCQGDSGGPLVKQHTNGLWYEHGIVSWGNGCALAGYPGVYSRVSAYCDFIKQYTGESCQD